MKAYNVAPFDQQLTLEDRLLEGNEKTLAQLRVFPGNVINLRVRDSFFPSVTAIACLLRGHRHLRLFCLSFLSFLASSFTLRPYALSRSCLPRRMHCLPRTQAPLSRS